MVDNGTLYVCATPIGNLADITLRVLDILKHVDLIAAEDTRHSRKLLHYYEINTPLTSYHEHNEKGKAHELLKMLKEGKSIGLISDAGMPGISDPGWEIINLCLKEQVKVDVLPGPNAALTALVLSGMPAEQFAFIGFLPSVAGERRKKLETLSSLEFTLIFYEAPHRLRATLKDMAEIFGNREAAVVREITKLHQSVHKNELVKLFEEFEQTPPKGECCILISPYVELHEIGTPEDWVRAAREYIDRGLKPNDAMKEAAKKFKISKRDVYQAMLAEK